MDLQIKSCRNVVLHRPPDLHYFGLFTWKRTPSSRDPSRLRGCESFLEVDGVLSLESRDGKQSTHWNLITDLERFGVKGVIFYPYYYHRWNFLIHLILVILSRSVCHVKVIYNQSLSGLLNVTFPLFLSFRIVLVRRLLRTPVYGITSDTFSN